MKIQGMNSYGFSNEYRISSIHGNPSSLQPIKRIDQNVSDANKALVIAQKEEPSPYVKDYGELKPTTSTVVQGFGDYLTFQQSSPITGEEEKNSKAFSDYLNDTIGVMGMNHRIREQLLVG